MNEADCLERQHRRSRRRNEHLRRRRSSYRASGLVPWPKAHDDCSLCGHGQASRSEVSYLLRLGSGRSTLECSRWPLPRWPSTAGLEKLEALVLRDSLRRVGTKGTLFVCFRPVADVQSIELCACLRLFSIGVHPLPGLSNGTTTPCSRDGAASGPWRISLWSNIDGHPCHRLTLRENRPSTCLSSGGPLIERHAWRSERMGIGHRSLLANEQTPT
jgi:hypothetical protein